MPQITVLIETWFNDNGISYDPEKSPWKLLFEHSPTENQTHTKLLKSFRDQIGLAPTRANFSEADWLSLITSNLPPEFLRELFSIAYEYRKNSECNISFDLPLHSLINIKNEHSIAFQTFLIAAFKSLYTHNILDPFFQKIEFHWQLLQNYFFDANFVTEFFSFFFSVESDSYNISSIPIDIFFQKNNQGTNVWSLLLLPQHHNKVLFEGLFNVVTTKLFENNTYDASILQKEINHLLLLLTNHFYELPNISSFPDIRNNFRNFPILYDMLFALDTSNKKILDFCSYLLNYSDTSDNPLITHLLKRPIILLEGLINDASFSYMFSSFMEIHFTRMALPEIKAQLDTLLKNYLENNPEQLVSVSNRVLKINPNLLVRSYSSEMATQFFIHAFSKREYSKATSDTPGLLSTFFNTLLNNGKINLNDPRLKFEDENHEASFIIALLKLYKLDYLSPFLSLPGFANNKKALKKMLIIHNIIFTNSDIAARAHQLKPIFDVIADFPCSDHEVFFSDLCTHTSNRGQNQKIKILAYLQKTYPHQFSMCVIKWSAFQNFLLKAIQHYLDPLRNDTTRFTKTGEYRARNMRILMQEPLEPKYLAAIACAAILFSSSTELKNRIIDNYPSACSVFIASSAVPNSQEANNLAHRLLVEFSISKEHCMAILTVLEKEQEGATPASLRKSVKQILNPSSVENTAGARLIGPARRAIGSDDLTLATTMEAKRRALN